MRKKFLVEQLAALKQKRQAENTRLATLAAAGSEVPTAEVNACLAIDDEVSKLQAELDGIEKLEARAKASVAEEQALAPAGGTQVHDRAEDKPFRGLGEFLLSVASAGAPNGTIDPRLRSLAPSGASEGVPGDGGFFVREEYASLLYNKGFEMAAVAPRCDRQQMGAGTNRIKIPIVNETSRATGSRWGGVRVYRTNEAGTVTATKPNFDYIEMAVEKLMGLAYATEELLVDATLMEGVFTRAFSSEFAFTIDDEIVRGDGAGKCLGILNAPALVTVSKESGQAADTIVSENIIKMYTRMPARNRGNAVWLVNQDIESQLHTMNLVFPTNAGGVATFLPPGGLSGQPYAQLYGRPIVPIEQASALGDLGDIMFVDLSEYLIIEKGGLNAAQSMHVRFLYDEMTFRWTMRNNGQPKWKSAITPYKGSNTVSPFVALQARA